MSGSARGCARCARAAPSGAPGAPPGRLTKGGKSTPRLNASAQSGIDMGSSMIRTPSKWMQSSAMLVNKEIEDTIGAEEKPMCLVIDEKAIEYLGTLCPDVIASVGSASRSVVACRARKDQKAQMLNLIKANVPSSTCLAIGAGAYTFTIETR